jgi:ankyrin repeat protein
MAAGMGPDTLSSPLHGAAQRGESQQVCELLAGGALVDERNAAQESALHRACMCGHQAVAAALLEAGANAEACDADGMRPLHLAAMGAQDSVVALLLACGTNHAAQARAGREPLHWAALYGAAGCCQLLVDVSANVDAVDSSGKTALQLAERKGHQAVLDVLTQTPPAAAWADAAVARPQRQGEVGTRSKLQSPAAVQDKTSAEISTRSQLKTKAPLERELEKIQVLLQTLIDVNSRMNPEPMAGVARSQTGDDEHTGVSMEGAAVLAVGAGMVGLALGFLCGRVGQR